MTGVEGEYYRYSGNDAEYINVVTQCRLVKKEQRYPGSEYATEDFYAFVDVLRPDTRDGYYWRADSNYDCFTRVTEAEALAVILGGGIDT